MMVSAPPFARWRLSRLLQSLIEEYAGPNKLDFLTNPRIRANYRECPDAIRQVTLQQEYIRGRDLSEIIQPELRWRCGVRRVTEQQKA